MGRRRRAYPACLADKLLAIRLSLNLSQTEMLKRTHPDQDKSLRGSIISEFERGVREPSLLETLAYARVAGAPVEQLTDDEFDLPNAIMQHLSTGTRRKRKNSLVGSIEILDDDLESGSQEIAKMFNKAIEYSGRQALSSALAPTKGDNFKKKHIGQTVYLLPPVHRQLRALAYDEERKMHDYLMEGLDLVFRKRGLKSIAELTEPKRN
jgi:transcriptional regulator with XRE-family HTH domain